MTADEMLERLRLDAIAAAATVDPEFAARVAEEQKEIQKMKERTAALEARKKENKQPSPEEQTWVTLAQQINNRSRG
jgi:Tfp pilus assembly protein PilN